MVKASDFLVGFIKEHYSKDEISKFMPLTEDSLYDLEVDIAHRFEYFLVNKQENGEPIDMKLLEDATKAGDELRDNEIDLEDLSNRLK